MEGANSHLLARWPGARSRVAALPIAAGWRLRMRCALHAVLSDRGLSLRSPPPPKPRRWPPR